MNQTGMNYFKKVRHRVSEFKISRYVYPEKIIFKVKMKSSTEWFVDKFHEVKVGYNGKYECYEVTRIFD